MYKIDKPTFSGHETFPCRTLWLKKGYDFVLNEGSFNSPDAVVTLGVGKNMVSSIRYWMRAFNILDTDDKLTEFAHSLLADAGWDPYLEDEGSIWLLHYQLVKKRYATAYNLIFNEFRKTKIEFSKENFVRYILSKFEGDIAFKNTENTVGDDFTKQTRFLSIQKRLKSIKKQSKYLTKKQRNQCLRASNQKLLGKDKTLNIAALSNVLKLLIENYLCILKIILWD